MATGSDMRVKVEFGGALGGSGGGAAYLVEDGRAAPDGAYAARFTLPVIRHFAGCACCAPRGPAAAALAAMFRARAVGAAPFFNAVIVLASAAGEAAVRDALAGDAVTVARYRAG